MENSERKFILEDANTSNWDSWVEKPLVSAIYSLKEIARMRGFINNDEDQALQMIMDWEGLPGWMPEDGKWLEWDDNSYRESTKTKESKFDKRLREAFEKRKGKIPEAIRRVQGEKLRQSLLEKLGGVELATSQFEEIEKVGLFNIDERMNFIDDVAKLLFMKNRGMYPDSCFERAKELWEAREKFIEEEVPQKEEPKERVAVQYWTEDGNTKNVWMGSGWMFEDSFEPEEEFWFLKEIIDYDKQGNPIKATFKRK